jgi:hypothetical protein
MPSQTDLDQGGTFRGWVRQFMGPSIGWISVPATNILAITAAGTFQLDLSTNLVTVNVVGAVTIKLPTATNPASGAGAQPGFFAENPVTIVDIGGHAQANPITIQPFSGSETIMGLNSISLSVNFGGYTLAPEPAIPGWNSISP